MTLINEDARHIGQALGFKQSFKVIGRCRSVYSDWNKFEIFVNACCVLSAKELAHLDEAKMYLAKDPEDWPEDILARYL